MQDALRLFRIVNSAVYRYTEVVGSSMGLAGYVLPLSQLR